MVRRRDSETSAEISRNWVLRTCCKFCWTSARLFPLTKTGPTSGSLMRPPDPPCGTAAEKHLPRDRQTNRRQVRPHNPVLREGPSESTENLESHFRTIPHRIAPGTQGE